MKWTRIPTIRCDLHKRFFGRVKVLGFSKEGVLTTVDGRSMIICRDCHRILKSLHSGAKGGKKSG